MNYEEILQTVRGFCVREKLLDGKKHLALAVSGGADSMALLCLMRPLAEEKGIALTVCHVNHGLRGETADRDEAFVREVCARLGLPLEETVAAGDSANDLSMLRTAGLGVCMDNGTEDAKAAADRIIGDVREDGLAALIEELWFDGPKAEPSGRDLGSAWAQIESAGGQ